MNNNILYIYDHDPKQKGVINKINGFEQAVIKMGYNIEIINMYGVKSLFKYYKKMIIIIKSNAKIIYYRTGGILTLFFYVYFIIAKLQGKKLIIEVPTPMIAVVMEVFNSNRSKAKKWVYIFLIYINGPWIYWIFNKIIQYGNEGVYFYIGNNKKTILIGNGININQIKIRNENNKWPDDKLILIGVASNISFYHAYDRVIKAIYIWNNENREYYVKFNIIGNGEYVNVLKEMVKKYRLEEYIIFHGTRDMDYIYKYYSIAHIAVSSLGFYRLKINTASPLKSREYCAVGIPFIAAGDDPDFPKEVPFRINVSNDDNIVDIIRVFKSISEIINNNSNEKIRKYAENNLSYENKIKQMI